MHTYHECGCSVEPGCDIANPLRRYEDLEKRVVDLEKWLGNVATFLEQDADRYRNNIDVFDSLMRVALGIRRALEKK